MRDLSYLVPGLQATKGPLESHDARFLELSDAAERRDFARAADGFEALLAENLFDPRLAAYHAFQAFKEDGYGRLADVLERVATLLPGAVEGGKKSTAYLNKGYAWLFAELCSELEYERARKTDTWFKWVKQLSELQERPPVVQRATELNAALPAEMSASVEGLQKLLRLLRQVDEELGTGAVDVELEKPAEKDVQRPAASAPERKLKLVPHGMPMQITPSPRLVELCNKLAAFERLVEKRQFDKAALVSDDILEEVTHFDPRRYFPELFGKFGQLLNRHVQELKPHLEMKETVEWRTLAQYYQVDLEGFVGDE
ncbi:MAG: hypothetical protein RL653_106 [Pseudomonadota bacterium]|jgi:hypothetical protein